MLRKLVVLVLFGVLLIGGIAYSQPMTLSETQMEDTIGGMFRTCGATYNCLGHDAGCVYQDGAYVWYLPYLRLRCQFALTTKSCVDDQYLYCGEKRIYYFEPCGGQPNEIIDQNTWCCG